MLRWVDRKLLEASGEKEPGKRPDPLDVLVKTVLSQNTSDGNRDRAYQGLRGRFPSWERVMTADPRDIEEAIRPGGLGRQKSVRIKRMLQSIKQREGKLDLKRVCKMETQDALEYLYSFKGVAEKTAAVVLLFSCQKPVFPVDTHILRVSKRLGLLPVKADARKAHALMGELVPPEAAYRLHLNFIEHGRKICRPKPMCGECTLNTRCISAFKV